MLKLWIHGYDKILPILFFESAANSILRNTLFAGIRWYGAACLSLPSSHATVRRTLESRTDECQSRYTVAASLYWFATDVNDNFFQIDTFLQQKIIVSVQFNISFNLLLLQQWACLFPIRPWCLLHPAQSEDPDPACTHNRPRPNDPPWHKACHSRLAEACKWSHLEPPEVR